MKKLWRGQEDQRKPRTSELFVSETLKQFILHVLISTCCPSSSKSCINDQRLNVFIEIIVTYDWVDGAVGHGQPVEAQVDVLDVGGLHDIGTVVRVEEVAVAGEPADAEDCDHHGEHLDDPPLVPLALHRAVRHLARRVAPQSPA